MRALQVVAHVITTIVATKQTWKPNIFMVPARDCPPIAPTLQHFQDISHPASLKHKQRGVKENYVVEIQSVRLEQIGKAPFDGVMDIIVVLFGYEFCIDQLLHRHLAQVRLEFLTMVGTP